MSITTLERDTQAAQFKARGQNATDEQVVDELVSLSLMSQEAEKMGLDKTPAMAAEMKIMRARVLANALLTQFTEKLDLSEPQKNIQQALPDQTGATSAGSMRVRWFRNFPRPSPRWNQANTVQTR